MNVQSTSPRATLRAQSMIEEALLLRQLVQDRGLGTGDCLRISACAGTLVRAGAWHW